MFSKLKIKVEKRRSKNRKVLLLSSEKKRGDFLIATVFYDDCSFFSSFIPLFIYLFIYLFFNFTR